VNGVEVVNGDLNVNVDRQGRILSLGDAFYRGKASEAKNDKSVWESMRDALRESGTFYKIRYLKILSFCYQRLSFQVNSFLVDANRVRTPLQNLH
jgi:hypothetical protein